MTGLITAIATLCLITINPNVYSLNVRKACFTKIYECALKGKRVKYGIMGLTGPSFNKQLDKCITDHMSGKK